MSKTPEMLSLSHEQDGLNATATIELAGAITTSFVINGQDILVPKPDDSSTRFGSFWADPFGPESLQVDDEYVRKHGELRVNDWTTPEGTYNILEFTDPKSGLVYTLNTGMYDPEQDYPAVEFHQLLTINNPTDNTVEVAPAMHPYFNLSLEEALNQALFQNLGVSKNINPDAEEYARPDQVKFSVGQYNVELRTGMGRVTFWSPESAESVCVEPSAVGQPYVLTNSSAAKLETIDSHEARKYRCSILVSRN